MRNLVIYGAGGHGHAVSNLALDLGFKEQVFIDPFTNLTSLNNFSILKEIDKDISTESLIVIAVGSIADRKKIFNEIENSFEKSNFVNLIHPTSVISNNSVLGIGNVIFPKVVLGAKVEVGNFGIINTASVIEHDSKIGDFVNVSPGVICGGNVNIGSNSLIGIGAIIRNGITVSNDSIIGPAAYVNRNTDSYKKYYGIPAKTED